LNPLGNDLQRLRSVNLVATTVLIPWKALNIRRSIVSRRPRGKERTDSLEESFALSEWITANIALFPPLFFFSALFYTDLWSVFWVLQTIETSLAPEIDSERGFARTSKIVAFGVISLWFRQTNVFWVALFTAGMDTTRALKTIDARPLTRQLGGHDWLEIFTISWNERKVYDPPIEDADFQGITPSMIFNGDDFDTLIDYLKTAFSIAIGILGGIKPVLQCLIPYGTLISLFTAFVAWNGGVVLGE
jgi:alpha-1,2-glucosyltransferase